MEKNIGLERAVAELIRLRLRSPLIKLRLLMRLSLRFLPHRSKKYKNKIEFKYSTLYYVTTNNGAHL